MPPNPHRIAVRDARHNDRELNRLYGRYIGSARHPRGRIRSAYRQARLALSTAYRTNTYRQTAEALDVIEELRASLTMIGGTAIAEAVTIGVDSGQRQVQAYRDAGVYVEPAMEYPDRSLLLTGWGETVEGQLNRSRTLVLTGAEEELLLGDGPSLDAQRKGALQPAPLMNDAAFWIAFGLGSAFLAWILGRDPRPGRTPFQKQAVAAIDERTTDCCLRVHGQVVDLDAQFKLTGTPRYADRMEWTPFHWYCRSSVALYVAGFDDGLTGQMEEAASAELTAREAGRKEIHPAHARSVRA